MVIQKSTTFYINSVFPPRELHLYRDYLPRFTENVVEKSADENNMLSHPFLKHYAFFMRFI